MVLEGEDSDQANCNYGSLEKSDRFNKRRWIYPVNMYDFQNGSMIILTSCE